MVCYSYREEVFFGGDKRDSCVAIENTLPKPGIFKAIFQV